MELTRYGASRVVLPGTGPLPGYGGYGSSVCHVLE